jgi:hypothetical protein
MKMFAHHYPDTPHGESHAPISISVLLTMFFVGAQWIIFVFMAVAVRTNEPTIYSGSNPFTVASVVVAALLMAFLLVDFRRNRIEAHGRQQFQFIVFGLAAIVLTLFMYFMVRVMQFGGPLG